MKKVLKLILIIVLLLAIGFVLGPKERFVSVNNNATSLDIPLDEIAQYVIEKEQRLDVKPGNHARVTWADSVRKTEYAFVYLHGFSASHGEGITIMDNLVKRYKYNAYLSRLSQHGLMDENAMESLTPANWVESAKEAIAIGKIIGEKVIVVSTSTGSTLGSYLATGDPDISHLVMMSPNFDLYDTNSNLMMMPWGKQMLKFMMKGNYHYWNIDNKYVDAFWTRKKRIEGLIALRSLLDQTMTSSTFEKINNPYFIGYYYEDENNMDDVISIEAIKKFHSLTATPRNRKMLVAYDDAQGHVIGCRHLNKNWRKVQDDIFSFLDQSLN